MTSDCLSPSRRTGLLDSSQWRRLQRFRLSPSEQEALTLQLRILLATDGTVTHLLEILKGEEVAAQKLQQREERLATAVEPLGARRGDRLLHRKVALRAKATEQLYLLAESVIMVDRLPRNVSDALCHTNEPIGAVLANNRLETFREILDVWVENTTERVTGLFGVDHPVTAPFAARNYRIIRNGLPVMLITEYFVDYPLLGLARLGGVGGEAGR